MIYYKMTKYSIESLSWLNWIGKKKTRNKLKKSKQKKSMYKTRQAREKHWQPLTKQQEKKRLRWYIEELDKVHSKWVRQQGERCVTCGSKENLQNWHFISRKYYEFRWDNKNCHIQCYRCNVALHWNYIEYTKFMIKKYGIDFVTDRTEKIKDAWYKNKKPSVEWLKQKIKAYKELLITDGCH